MLMCTITINTHRNTYQVNVPASVRTIKEAIVIAVYNHHRNDGKSIMDSYRRTAQELDITVDMTRRIVRQNGVNEDACDADQPRPSQA